ncbi:hypothetical protein POM88_023341 [Heracleum sosnowskyi]|uniref:Uncharacterized protein n=1 Tax=Heracleum sosnowskyi TaxID=360622 RepID=A0AAD8MUG3_9APIA|nr:hypothetical protein POM88_023341 [Heracleum sosnowskyi]
MARMLNLKSEHHWSEACYDQTSQFVKSVLPPDNSFIDSFYNTKKHFEGLGLPSVKIDCCVNGCMIYWGEDKDMESCKFCSQSRYKTIVDRSTREKKKVVVKRMIYFPLAPRLQRLYASPATATHMRWHAEHDQEEETKHRKVPRNDSSGGGQSFSGNFSICSHPGRAHGVGKTRYLDGREYTAAKNYVLFNCPEVAPYIKIFTNGLREHNPRINGAEIDKCLESDFAMWFKLYAQNTSLVPNEFIRDLASGPLRSDRSVPVYYVNGYKFHTRIYRANKSTFNSGRCKQRKFFFNYPSLRRDKVDWLVVCKVKARPLVELPQISESRNQDAYQDDFPEHLDVISTDDIEGTSVDFDDDEESPEEEIEIDSDEEEFSKTDESDFYDSDDA